MNLIAHRLTPVLYVAAFGVDLGLVPGEGP
jgi:hypothetical protein